MCAHAGSETPNQSNPSPIEPDPASLPCKKADANPAGRLARCVCLRLFMSCGWVSVCACVRECMCAVMPVAQWISLCAVYVVYVWVYSR